MRKFIVLIIVLNVLPPLIVFSQESLAPSDILINPDMLVRELPQTIIGYAEPTALGGFRFYFDDLSHQMVYQFGENEISRIALPEGFDTELTQNVVVAPEGSSAEICSLDYQYFAGIRESFGEGFRVDFQKGIFEPTGQCRYVPLTWMGTAGESYAGETTSPDGNYTVHIEESVKKPETCSSLPPLVATKTVDIIVKSASVTNVAGCTTAQGIRFDGWIDESHLLLRYYNPHSQTLAVEELLVLSADDGKIHSLGLQLGDWINLSLFDNDSKIARITVHNWKPNEAEPGDCAVNVTDLKTLQSVDIEPTLCSPNAQLYVEKESNQLFYLNSFIEDDPLKPVTTPRVINLNTLEIKRVDISGTIVELHGLTPNLTKLVLIVDSSRDAVVGSSQLENVYVTPRWLVYDMQQGKIVYEKALLNFGKVVGPLDYIGVGLSGMRWLDDGWNALLVTDSGEASVVIAHGDEITEHKLENISVGQDGISASWSPDGQYARLDLLDGTSPTYLLTLPDLSMSPIIKSIDTEKWYMSLEWYGEENLILVRIINREEFTTYARWLIDPSV